MTSETRNGWLLDFYARPSGGVRFWFLFDDGVRQYYDHDFPVSFYAAGPAQRLRELWRYLRTHRISVKLKRTERRDLFSGVITVLEVCVPGPIDQRRIFYAARTRFSDLTWYDADVPLSLRCAARYDVFPLARCQITTEAENLLAIIPLEAPWDIDPERPPLRILHLELDSDPARRDPTMLHVRTPWGKSDIPLDFDTRSGARRLLVGIAALLKRTDPDLLVIPWGDTWVLPRLLDLSEKWDLPLPLNRDLERPVERRKELSYHSYGQIVYRGQQVHLFGRIHIDPRNAMLHGDYGLEGAMESARLTGMGIQDAARKSPGAGISAMQLITALRSGILIPYEKQQAETPKSALDLIHADRGGLVYPPIIGLHRHVAEIDFVSMYPALMVHNNISPEIAEGERDERPSGLVPRTLAPLLAKRVALKERLLNMPVWHPTRNLYKARASAQKWLLVTCFGYLGYKNARFGRIEAHEAVTSAGRDALLTAKEAAEDAGYRVLHLYVDGLWVQRAGYDQPKDQDPLLEEIARRAGLPIALEGVYDWVAFLPSRVDERLAVPNRYFGRFQSGEIKMRGIASRRRDTPLFVKETQIEMIKRLPANPDRLGEVLPDMIAFLQARITSLRSKKVSLEHLVTGQRLSRVLTAYRVLSPAARAAKQLEAIGKYAQPGMRVYFIYTLGKPGVWAWNLPDACPSASIDTGRYIELLLRAAAEVLWPFGIAEQTVRNWLGGGGDFLSAPGIVPPRRSLPMFVGRRI